MKISKIRDVKTPLRGTKLSAGIDFFVPNDVSWEVKTINPGESVFLPSGIKANVPKGFMLVAMNKSGVAVKKNLHVGACVVDEDYQGEIHINLTNVGSKDTTILKGEKIVQFILLPVSYDSIELINEKDLYEQQTERGSGGFGSTGIK